MKNALKKIYDEYSVNEVPKDKENEYFTQEQSLEIGRRIRAIALNQVVLFTSSTVIVVITILKEYIGLSRQIETLISIVAIVGIIVAVALTAILYKRFRKFMKDISEDSLDK